MEIILMTFPKYSCLEQMDRLRRQKGISSQLWISYKNCFTILQYEMSRERHGNYFMGFSEKKSYSRQFGHFGQIMARSYNFGSALRLFFNIVR